MNHKTYIGDGVYLHFSGYGFTITTENGIAVQNTVFFEPEVLKAFIDMARKMLLDAKADNRTIAAYGLLTERIEGR